MGFVGHGQLSLPIEGLKKKEMSIYSMYLIYRIQRQLVTKLNPSDVLIKFQRINSYLKKFWSMWSRMLGSSTQE